MRRPAGSACISRPRAAISDEPVVEVEQPGDVGGHVLADAVADDGRRLRRPTTATARPAPTSSANSAGWV